VTKKILRVLVLAVLVGLMWAFLQLRRFEDVFLRYALKKDQRFLEREMGLERSQRVVEGIKKHWEEVEELWPAPESVFMRRHRIVAIHGLALYRALLEELRADENPLGIVEELFWQTHNIHLKVFAYILRKSRDPFRIWEWGAPLFVKYLYPKPPYEWELIKGGGVIGFDIKKCPSYCEFYKEAGVPELTPAICKFDFHMMTLFPPQIEMKRELCMGEGDDICDFRWYRR
jgi:hypothetical protein